MTWAGQSVFALPCGSTGGADLYGVSLPTLVFTSSSSFVAIPGMLLNVPVTFRRAAAILLMGSVTNDTGAQVSEFVLEVDSVAQLEVCAVEVPSEDGGAAVSLCSELILDPGSYAVQAMWRLLGGGELYTQPRRLRLEVILGQAVP